MCHLSINPVNAVGSRQSDNGVHRAKAAFSSGRETHPAILLQPEAIGAVMEVTKWLIAPDVEGHIW